MCPRGGTGLVSLRECGDASGILLGPPRPPRGPPGATPNPPAPRGRRLEGNRVQRGVGSPRCGRAAAVARPERPRRGGLGGLTPPHGGPAGQAGAAGALHGPMRHLRGSGELRGRSGGGISASPGAPLRRYNPLLVGVPYRHMPTTGVLTTSRCLRRQLSPAFADNNNKSLDHTA